MSEALRTVALSHAPRAADATVPSRTILLRWAALGLLSTTQISCFRPDTTLEPQTIGIKRPTEATDAEPISVPVQPPSLGEIPEGKDLRNTLLKVGGIQIGLFIEKSQVTIRCGDQSYRIKSIVTSADLRTGNETCLELSERTVQNTGGMIGLTRTKKGLYGSVFWIGGEVTEADLEKLATELAAPRMIEDEGDIRLDLPLVDNKMQSLTLVRKTESND